MYKNSQEMANVERKHKKLEYLHKQYQQKQEELDDKKFVELTLVENDISIDNLIRYDSGWVFGWRDLMSQKEAESIQNKLNKILELWSGNLRDDSRVIGCGVYSPEDYNRLLVFTNNVQYKVKL